MAEVKIRFVNMDRSLALEDYTREHIQSLTHRLDGRHGSHKMIEVRFSLDAKDSRGRIRDTEAMISYHYPGISETFHVRKHDPDPHRALIEAIHALEVVVQKATDKMRNGRHYIGKSKHSVQDLKNPDYNSPEPEA